jgi:hypothetical protein
MSHTAFDFLIQAPAETYVDHMILAEGWAEMEPQEQTAAPWISHGKLGYHLGIEIDYRTLFLQDVFVRFGGAAVSRVLEFSAEKIEDYCNEYDNQDRFGVWSGDLIFQAAKRYLSGQALDAECEFLINYLK